MAKSLAKAGATKGDITLRGGYVGSPLYLAPEQITNYRWVKPPTDVFEIAASFYHAITGHPVWTIRKGEDPLRAILEGKITPILQREPKIPRELAAVKTATQDEYHLSIKSESY